VAEGIKVEVGFYFSLGVLYGATKIMKIAGSRNGMKM
jgi:hypothetical protein